MMFEAFVVLILGFQGITGSEPECPRDSFQRHMLDHVIETKTVIKQIDEHVGEIINKLDDRIDGESFKKIQNEMKSLTARIGVTEHSVNDLQKKLDEDAIEPRQNHDIVAFSVMLVERLAQNTYHDIIQFDKVVLNQGNHYNKHTGQFTVPVDGIYMFSGSLMADNDAEVWGSIKTKLGDTLARMYARGTNDRHDQGGNSLIVALIKGDVVSMHGGPKLYGGVYTSFSGHLLLHKQ